jgi:hypothetical protein
MKRITDTTATPHSKSISVGDSNTSRKDNTDAITTDTNNTDSLTESDVKTLRVVQDALKDKLAVITHGPFTAEAYEPSHKAKAHEQLQIARRIRATLEHAYHQAKESNSVEMLKKIFDDQRHVIYELISLTNAVQGRYVLDTYDEFNTLSKKIRMEEEQRHCNSLKQINSVWKDLYYSKRPDELLEDQVKKYLQKKANRVVDKQSTLKITKPSKSQNTSKEPHNLFSQNRTIQKVTARAPKPEFHNPRSRQCHYCSTWSRIYRQCEFWFDNGTQCRKSFCLKCLRGNPDFEQEANSMDDQWQCPSCLGHCSCHRCMKRKNGL